MIISPRIALRISFSVATFLSHGATVARGFSVCLPPKFGRVTTAAATSTSTSTSSLEHRDFKTVAAAFQQPGDGSKSSRIKLFSTTARGGDEDVETDADSDASEESGTGTIPVTFLAGFLGSGKTTTLQNLLTNNEGLKIGIIVNDVASINIDNKLLANPNYSQDETVELQNGCACCSLADELITSVEQLLVSKDGTRRDFDVIVVELSGVADPVQVKNNWNQAVYLNHPATKMASMDKVVTLVDSSTFGTDWMSWDSSSEREGWVDPNESCGEDKTVPVLLAEQIEAADILIINKVDLAGEEQVQVASSLAKSLNDKAHVFETKFGEISIREVFAAAKVQTDMEEDDEGHTPCTEPDCTDESHSHSHEHHSHDHGHDAAHSHDHHSHDHDQCADGCTDPTHSHSHSHDHDGECTDESHSHSHSHSHSPHTEIKNFVYKADRPFVPARLLTILNKWPVPVKDELDFGQLAEAAVEGYKIGGKEERSPFVGVLRSKGFCWMAPTKWIGANDDVWRHNTCMFWSHAGKHFGISTAGKWWGTIKREQMKMYFVNNMKEYERIIDEDFVTEEFGDRRQEIVFIGANIDQEKITSALDACLADDKEMEEYRNQLKDFEASMYSGFSVKPFKSVGPNN